ncbi:MAG: DEAD/DEAH box helicase, partial [Myxococcota bacterium]
MLLLTPRFGYQAHEGSSSNVDVDDPSTLVVLYSDDGRPVLMERDDEAEDDACAALAFAILGVDNANEVRWPVRLRGVEAYDFLEEVLPGLREQGWVIFGVSSLRAHQIHRMNVEVSVASDVDWFDVGVGFEAAEEVVPTADVLESWALGRRYHRLRDGSVARLPERWLERHGHTLSELRDVQRAAGRRLGAWAAPMAKELLEAAEPSEGQKTWRRLAELLETFETIPDVEPCVPVQATLRDYQKIGVRWLSFLRDTGLGGILADDMGLGKTLQVLVTLADTHGLDRGMMSLVVAPVSVLRNWAAEAKRFVPGLNVHVHHGHNRRDTVPPDTDVIITSYALLRLELERFAQTRYRYVVLDEAQHIKNARSQVARAARLLRANHRLALTGTPLENNLHDLWSLFQFVMPGFFGSEASFRRRYARPIQADGDMEALRRLKARLRPFVLRRLKSDVALELPPHQEQVLYCDLGPDQRRLYEQIRATWRSVVLKEVDTRGVGGATLTVLEALTRLRQTCCDARLVPLDEARHVQGSAKMELLSELLDDVLAGGHRSLIFSQWPSLLKLVRAMLAIQIEVSDLPFDQHG